MNDRMFGRPSGRFLHFCRREEAVKQPITVSYSGEHTSTYDHETGLGLVGKVLGPNRRQEWFVITEAHYDTETDTTHATAELLGRPKDLS